jgi:sugar phosphate isomerase/epimerase
MREIMDNNGLEIIVTHNGYDALYNNTDEIIEKHNIYGCKYAGIGSMPGNLFSRYEERSFYAFAEKAEEISQRLLKAGIRFVYHNHNFELYRFGKKTGLDIIYDNTKTMQGEIDTFWIVAGGGDPVEWIDRLHGRMDLIHFKDFGIDKDGGRVFKEIGEGNLNWPAIIKACKRNNINWYIVEQDKCEVDPFTSLEISYKNLKAMGVE